MRVNAVKRMRRFVATALCCALFCHLRFLVSHLVDLECAQPQARVFFWPLRLSPQEKSQKQLRKALMPKKKRKLYDHIEKKKQNRQKKISRLEQKKAALDAAKEAAASGAPAVATRGGSKRNQK